MRAFLFASIAALALGCNPPDYLLAPGAVERDVTETGDTSMRPDAPADGGNVAEDGATADDRPDARETPDNGEVLVADAAMPDATDASLADASDRPEADAGTAPTDAGDVVDGGNDRDAGMVTADAGQDAADVPTDTIEGMIARCRTASACGACLTIPGCGWCDGDQRCGLLREGCGEYFVNPGEAHLCRDR